MNKKTLINNIKILNKKCPELVNWMRSQKTPDWISPIRSENGSQNLLIKQGAQLQPAYSMENPKKESRNTAAQVPLYKEDISVVIGMGLGYLVKALLEKAEKGHRIVVVEPVGYMLTLGLSTYNFEKYLNNGSLIIVPGKEELAMVIGALDSFNVIENWIIRVSEYTLRRIDEYQDITNYTIELINQARCNTGTVMGAGGQLADNDISNLPYVIKYRGVVELKDLFKDKPAILVSTGPSLSKNIHELLEMRDKVIIIAVAQALRPLLAYDIEPDFICTVDFGEVNMSHLKGLMDSTVPLVALNRTYAPLLKEYQGPKFIVATPSFGFEHTATSVLKDKGYVDQGGSVAHLCLSLAKFMGCNPITLIGQDLAYEGNLSHIPLVDSGGKVEISSSGRINWKVTDQRSHLHDDKGHSMGAALTVPGYFGGIISTNAGLASFITSFEALAKAYGITTKLFNSTEGGARIRGMKEVMLKDFYEEYVKNSSTIDRSILIPLRSYADDAEDLIVKAISLLYDDIKNLDEIHKYSELGLNTNKDMKALVKEKGDGNWTDESKNKLLSLFKENKEHSIKAREVAKKNPLIILAIYNESRQIQGRTLNVNRKIKHVLNHDKDLKTRLDSNELILKAAKEASAKLKEAYEKVLKLLEKYRRTGDDSLLRDTTEEEVVLTDVKQYFDSGNFAHPLLDARRRIKEIHEIIDDIFPDCEDEMVESGELEMLEEELKEVENVESKALKMRNTAIEKAKKINKDYLSKLLKYNELIENGQETGKKERDFNKALELLKEAKELLPVRVEARWGLASTYYFLKEYDKAEPEYRKLIKNTEEALSSLKEEYPEWNENKFKSTTHTFRFELGQVLIASNRIEEGLQEIAKVMGETEEYDSFLARIGYLNYKAGRYKRAIEAYEKYLSKFGADHIVWKTLGECYSEMGDSVSATKALSRALQIKNSKVDTNYFENILDEVKVNKE